MSNMKLLLAAALLSGRSLPTGALVLRQNDSDDVTAFEGFEEDSERRGKGKGNRKSKGKGKGKDRDVPRDPATAPGLDAGPPAGNEPSPVLGPGQTGRGNQIGVDPNNGGREGAPNEEPPPPPPPDPNQEPPMPPPPPGQERPPPPSRPRPETSVPVTSSSRTTEAARSTSLPLAVPVISSRPTVPAAPSSPTPVPSFAPPNSPQPNPSAPNIPQPFPQPSPPPSLPQSRLPPPPVPPASSPAPINPVLPPPLISNQPTVTLPAAQPTDARSGPTSFSAPAGPSSTSLTDSHGAMGGNNSQGIAGNRSLVIALSTVFSVLGVVLVVGAICLCYRYRRGRRPFGRRGDTPIDDEEIESWKACRTIEKSTTVIVDKTNSSGSIRKPASVIVYQNNTQSQQYQPRASTDTTGQRSLHHKRSMDKKSIEMPQTPVLARAPNARVGLTDDSVEGDVAFLPSPKRQNSRLSKLPPLSPRHGRHRSSRSSASVGSLRDHWYGYQTDLELSPRTSSDPYSYMPSSAHSDGRHKRLYTSSEQPPRLSLDEEFQMGGLSPRPFIRQSDIGVAVG
ncbi:hypothetical protein CCHL11_04994 [Colletotrichum chlorophyti]|uniref:Uncharacterized protein n=1 Tax=Colletotrichum chlorophyti TaxID=708187 RepID=A0A1Q8S397_9PEZI|nr:hypothetical protein CCHL11_04994 [Colletotrichum chlorophyti]